MIIVVFGLTSMSPFAPAAPRPSGKPDLSIDEARIDTSLYFQTLAFGAGDCAVLEACVDGSGQRKLMRFDVAIRNTGTADLVIGKPSKHPEWFTYSPCHGHYHFNGFIEYELFDLQNGFVVAGRKQAFCLEDYERIPGYVGGGNRKFTCSNQGITVGWQDVYRAALDCQWLDVTNVPPGDYVLMVTVDAGQKFAELNENNNMASVLVTIP
jgi:hypothetical protein